MFFCLIWVWFGFLCVVGLGLALLLDATELDTY